MFFSLTAGLEASVPLSGKWSVLLGLFCGILEHVKIDGSLSAGWNTVMWVNLRTGHFVRAFFFIIQWLLNYITTHVNVAY